MGSAISAENKRSGSDLGGTSSSSPGLGDIPESCISSVLMNLEATDICKLARVNKAFHRASSADFVWESKLPSSYKFLLHQVLGGHDHDDDQQNLQNSFTKKQIYSILCRPNRFHSGSKEAWLDRGSGQVCLFMSAKSMKITGIDDRRYWNYIPTEESRFNSIAYLQQMWWVEVVGDVEFEFPKGRYSLNFRLQLGRATKKLGRRVCNVDQVHGWNIKPVRFELSTSDGQHAHSEYYLRRPGEWAHYHVGDFEVGPHDGPINIKFSLAQIDCTHAKGGLSVDCAFIGPTEFSQTDMHTKYYYYDEGPKVKVAKINK
ncbi:F-box protein PP2-A14 [Neltuma alba]|uniref:F-box protein PP2-A14 n=1 Tax=Neltuma alba TaxID=207710 RepID=UPI0010A4D58A|nr:F-box protein PP2-A14 [Prosopis alba]